MRMMTNLQLQTTITRMIIREAKENEMMEAKMIMMISRVTKAKNENIPKTMM